MASSSVLTAAAKSSYRVGIICGSQRVVRAGPQITDFVADVIRSKLAEPASSSLPPIELEIVDVATLGLPLSDEPGVPSQIRSADGYAHEHTRVWSRRIAALDAFVFVTPQYNWGLPAGLKNAIDYLFNEWKGKPAMVVAYGGHGGDKAATALAMVLGGLHMRAVDGPILLAFPDRQTVARAAGGQDLGLVGSAGSTAADGSMWSDRREDIAEAWTKLVALLLA